MYNPPFDGYSGVSRPYYPAHEQVYFSTPRHYVYVQQQGPPQRPRKCILRLAAEAAGWCISVAACILCSAVGGAISCCRAAALEADEFVNHQQPPYETPYKQYHLQQVQGYQEAPGRSPQCTAEPSCSPLKQP
ncbi:hypothetical protein cyc_03700 [Cyclospora cayetanensis]|uniref:Uncharacterized protein n=1 Tax=Cyclospora cayetanensis TaxID=88456 RepID=A0A1D3CSV9_9EIME|nr:hypothetical protein cyc_03700 [Cyclospora cayetanensis]